jgi:hypothetical protein
MTQYMVERYVPGASEAGLEASRRRIERATAQISAGGTLVRYLGSTVVPEEESCFFWFESTSAATVRRVFEQARVSFARIVVAHGRAPVEHLQ